MLQNHWKRIEFFSVYGFNKSHAIAYALDSYYAAWLHTHYETDWLGTILESENNNPATLSKAISEIKAMGYEVGTPDINESGLCWSWSRLCWSRWPWCALVFPAAGFYPSGRAAGGDILRVECPADEDSRGRQLVGLVTYAIQSDTTTVRFN